MALLQHLGSENRPGDAALVRRIAGMKDTIADTLAANTAPHPDENPIHPGVVMEAMIDVLDDDAIIASDVGSCQIWGQFHRRIATPHSFVQSGGWNVMSFALPTAAEYGANILIVIMNNGTFGQTFMQQKTIYGHTFGTTFTCPDFAAMARSCGAEGIRVSDPAQVGDAMGKYRISRQ
jgi:thiamine pyrophosphate-dependent acetolactate synthase large subunit-like protein